VSDAAIAAPTAAPPHWAVVAGRIFVIFMGPSLGGLVPLGLAIAQPAIAQHFGGGDEGRALARTLFALPSLMIMIGAPLGGYLAERFGYRLTLLVSLLAYSLGGTAGLLVDGFAPLLISRLVLGLAGGTVMAVYLALAAAWYEGTARAKVLGFAVASSAVVGVLALKLGGNLVAWGGWRGPFAMYLLGFVTLAAAWATVRGPFHAKPRAARTQDGPGALAVIVQLWPVYLVLLLLSVGTFTPSAGGPFLLKENGIADPVVQGDILSAGAIPSIFTAMAYGFLRRWFSDWAILILTATLMGAGLMAAVPLHTPALLLATFVTLNLGTGFKAPVTASVLMAEAPEPVRATAAGLSFSGIFLGQFLAPTALELLGRPFGVHGAFLAIGGTLIAVAAFVGIAGIGRIRPSQGAPT
jgi:MFS family permease